MNSASPLQSPVACPNAKLVLGVCKTHFEKRYRWSACKRRDCPSCGPLGRAKIAERIRKGVEHWQSLGQNVCWLVPTFPGDEALQPGFKKKAVEKLRRFILFLREELGVDTQYCWTAEVGELGRFHFNLLVSNWNFIDADKILAAWGARISFDLVWDPTTIANEVSKNLSEYLTKVQQSVAAEWGRRVGYSRGWPSVPESSLERVGLIDWRPATQEERILFKIKEGFKLVKYVADGEWGCAAGEICGCFQTKKKGAYNERFEASIEGRGHGGSQSRQQGESGYFQTYGDKKRMESERVAGDRLDDENGKSGPDYTGRLF